MLREKLKDREGNRRGGEWEPNKISFARNWPMSHIQNPKQKPLKQIDEEQ
jgi:hypothetical protein